MEYVHRQTLAHIIKKIISQIKGVEVVVEGEPNLLVPSS